MAFGEDMVTTREEDDERGSLLLVESNRFIGAVSFLGVGQEFVGTQNVSSVSCVHPRSGHGEAWQLTVRLQGTDFKRGYLCGVMEALNVPSANSSVGYLLGQPQRSVITFWEGEIVDNQNFTFFTGKWEAKRETDMEHWSKFSGFASLRDAVLQDGAQSVNLSQHPYIFMRWKERFFVNVNADCGLTIAGFYYICYSRADGSVQGFYYDPNSTPFQKLDLHPRNDGRIGQTFGSFTIR